MSEIENLRAEIAALRKELDELKASREVHHYHHQGAPASFVQPQYQTWPGVSPTYPGGPLPITSGRRFTGMAYGGTDVSADYGPRSL